jgi:hypothetical protein
MNMPMETKPVLWGAAGGAVVLAIVGFSWGAWVTGSKAGAAALARADAAVAHAEAPTQLLSVARACRGALTRV